MNVIVSWSVTWRDPEASLRLFFSGRSGIQTDPGGRVGHEDRKLRDRQIGTEMLLMAYLKVARSDGRWKPYIYSDSCLLNLSDLR